MIAFGLCLRLGCLRPGPRLLGVAVKACILHRQLLLEVKLGGDLLQHHLGNNVAEHGGDHQIGEPHHNF